MNPRAKLAILASRPRHPWERVYHCGFDPMGISLRELVKHWSDCAFPDCKAALSIHWELEMGLERKYGRGGTRVSLVHNS